MQYQAIGFVGTDILAVRLELVEYVQAMIEEGWIPQGGISLSVTRNPNTLLPTFHMAQALIKIEIREIISA